MFLPFKEHLKDQVVSQSVWFREGQSCGYFIQVVLLQLSVFRAEPEIPQLIQNVAAQRLTNTGRQNHIGPVLALVTS